MTATADTDGRHEAELLRFRALFDQAPGFAAMLTGRELRFTLANPAFQVLVGRRPLLGLTAADAFPGLAERIPATLVERLFADGEAYVASDMAIAIPDPATGVAPHRRIDFACQPIRGEDGAILAVFVTGNDVTDRFRAIETLRASEARLRHAQEAGGVGVFSVEGLDGRLEVTPAFCRIFGLPETATFPVGEIEALVLPEDAAIASTSSTRTRETLTRDVVYRIRRPSDGAVRWIARRAEFEPAAEGRPPRLTGVVQDITDQRSAQTTIAESESRFRALVALLPSQIWTAGADGRIDWANQRAYAYGGHDEASLVAEGWETRLHPDDIPDAADAWRTAMARGGEYGAEFRLRRWDGQFRWHLARAVPIRDGTGAIVRWIGTNTDIDEERTVRLQLAELNATLEQRVAQATRERDRSWRNSRDIQVVIDTAGVFRAVNPAWTAILGHPHETTVGRKVIDYVHPDDVAPLRARAGEATRGDLTGFEHRYLHRDGSVRWLSWNTALEGELIYGYGRDVTALKQTEDQLRQAQKMEAVGQLTGGIAHDFNNLLTGIMGNLELLQARVAQGRLGDIARFVAAAQGAGRRAAALTQRLLAFSRRQTLDPKVTDVNRLIAGLEEMVRRSVGPAVAIEVVGAAGLWAALIDPGQLENALLNLCINGRDAMPDGGRLTIETANKWIDDRASRARDLPPGQYVSICVTDTGTGMTPEVIARAFDPFYTTKPIGQGTGLGLSMIYGFARQSGGQVRIYSEVGRGTTMCIYLPRHVGQADDVADPDRDPAPPAATGKTVLVVDDEPTVRQLIAEVLDESGYATIAAGDGAGGLKVLQGTAKIDLLVTDVGLPGGMNGRQVADAARALRPGLKVLFITGYAENAAVGNGHLEHGMELLTKPFTLEDLARRINAMLAD